MKRTLPQIQYSRLQALYAKLSARLNKQFKTGRFIALTKQQQTKLLQRIERIKGQLQRLSAGLKLSGAALALGAVFSSSAVQAQFAPTGTEFQVNTETSSGQESASVAMDSDGDFVVVWQSYGQDGSSRGIYGQRYNASGVAQGTEFLVNTYTSDYQRNPSVAMDSDGDFVVVWSSYQDGDYSGIYGQRYNAAGQAQGSEFRINTYTASYQNSPSVAMDSDGDFVVVWESFNQDGDDYGIYAQRYNASGVAQGSEFRVSTETVSDQEEPSVAIDNDGDFVVVWHSRNQDGSSNGIYGQRYNASGLAQGAEFRVNTVTSNNQDSASIAMDSDGDFVVVWDSYIQDGSSSGIYGQRYNASGVVQGTEFRVNTETTGRQDNPSISMDSDGDFVVVWTGRDGSSDGIFGQRYNASGVAQGTEFLVNTETSNSQSDADVAMDSNGDFIVAWQSSYQDGDGNGVYAQRYLGGFPTSVKGAAETEAAVLYPNPAQDLVFVNLEGEVSVRVLDLSGALQKTTSLENQSFSVADLNAGLYLIELTKEGATSIKKLRVE